MYSFYNSDPTKNTASSLSIPSASKLQFGFSWVSIEHFDARIACHSSVHHTLHQTVARQPVPSMDASCCFTTSKQSRNHFVIFIQGARFRVNSDSSHYIMQHRFHKSHSQFLVHLVRSSRESRLS